jgi:hypothetical protein
LFELIAFDKMQFTDSWVKMVMGGNLGQRLMEVLFFLENQDMWIFPGKKIFEDFV